MPNSASNLLAESKLNAAESDPAGDQRAREAILGITNEVGNPPGFLGRLLAAHRGPRRIEFVTAGTGRCSRETSEAIIRHGAHCFPALKDNQPDGIAEAKRLIEAPGHAPDAGGQMERELGHRVVHHVWCADVRNALERFPDATLFVRAQRVVRHVGGTLVSSGGRYFVTSMPGRCMTPHNAMLVARSHWTCEDRAHWTADVYLNEDRGHGTPLTRPPTLVVVVATGRAIATTIVSTVRALSRGDTELSPMASWAYAILQIQRCFVGSKRIRMVNESPAAS